MDIQELNIEYRSGWHVIQNRVKRTLDQITEFANWTINNLPEDQQSKVKNLKKTSIFSYVDTYTPVKVPHIIGKRVISLIERSKTNYLGNKLELGNIITRHGLFDYAPRTFTTINDALVSIDPKTSPVVYVKLRSGSSGRQVKCIATDDLKNFNLPQHYIIQEAVSDILLFDKRKLEFRFYILIHDKKIYLSTRGFSYVHSGREYDPTSTDWQEQVNKVNGTYITKTDDRNIIRVMSMEEMLHYKRHINELAIMIKGLGPVFQSAIDETDDKQYQLLGCDSISTPDFKMKLIEINSFPNLTHVEPLINEKVNSRVFASMMLLLVCEHNDGTWIEIK